MPKRTVLGKERKEIKNIPLGSRNKKNYKSETKRVKRRT